MVIFQKKVQFRIFFSGYFGPKTGSKINFGPNQKNTSPKDTDKPNKNRMNRGTGSLEPEMIVAPRRRHHHALVFFARSRKFIPAELLNGPIRESLYSRKLILAIGDRES